MEDRFGGTPLQDALQRISPGHEEVAQFLQSSAVQASRVGRRRVVVPGVGEVELTRTAHLATQGKEEALRRTLIGARCHGGDSLVREHLLAVDGVHGNTPIHWAAYAGSMECAQVLVLAAEASLPNMNKWLTSRNAANATPLHLAAQSNALQLVTFFLTTRADPHARDAEGNHALLSAACAGNAEIVQCLLQWRRNIRLELVNAAGKTPLTAAVESGSAETVRVLLEADARSVC